MDDIEDIMRMDKEKLAAPIKTIEVKSYSRYSVMIFWGKLFFLALGLAYNMYNNCINDNIFKTRFSDRRVFVLFCLYLLGASPYGRLDDSWSV